MLREVGRKATFYMLKYVKNNCKGGKNMDNTRRIYLDNIRWITVCIVVIYHVIYMYNGVQPFGVIGPFKEQQLQGCFSIFCISLDDGFVIYGVWYDSQILYGKA